MIENPVKDPRREKANTKCEIQFSFESFVILKFVSSTKNDKLEKKKFFLCQ